MGDRVVIRATLLSCAALLTVALAVSFASSRRDEQARTALFAPAVADDVIVADQVEVLQLERQPVVRTRSSR